MYISLNIDLLLSNKITKEMATARTNTSQNN